MLHNYVKTIKPQIPIRFEEGFNLLLIVFEWNLCTSIQKTYIFILTGVNTTASSLARECKIAQRIV